MIAPSATGGVCSVARQPTDEVIEFPPDYVGPDS